MLTDPPRRRTRPTPWRITVGVVPRHSSVAIYVARRDEDRQDFRHVAGHPTDTGRASLRTSAQEGEHIVEILGLPIEVSASRATVRSALRRLIGEHRGFQAVVAATVQHHPSTSFTVGIATVGGLPHHAGTSSARSRTGALHDAPLRSDVQEPADHLAYIVDPAVELVKCPRRHRARVDDNEHAARRRGS